MRASISRIERAYARRSCVLRCACGDDWCSAVLAEIRLDGDSVYWRNFWEKDSGPIDIGSFRFDRARYEAALRSNGDDPCT